jgi:hypothetical protein
MRRAGTGAPSVMKQRTLEKSAVGQPGDRVSASSRFRIPEPFGDASLLDQP